MGELPVPASMFFKDFSDSILEYQVKIMGSVIGTYKGLSNDDEGGSYIVFLLDDNPDIPVGSLLCTLDNLEQFHVIRVAYDRYKGKAELLKAYY